MGEHYLGVFPPPDDSEKWTLEQWETITHRWSPVVQFAARKAQSIPLEERAKRGGALFEERFEIDEPEIFELVANLMGLSEEALDRVVTSFPCRVDEIRLVKGSRICPFTALRRLPPLRDLTDRGIAFSIPLVYKSTPVFLRGIYTNFEGEHLILPLLSCGVSSLKEYRRLKRLTTEFAGNELYFLNLTHDTEEEEAQVCQDLRTDGMSVVHNRIFKDSQGEIISFPLPYRDFYLWRGVEMRLADRE